MTKLEKITLGLLASLVLLVWLAALPLIIKTWS
jgi:hypothetical protein